MTPRIAVQTLFAVLIALGAGVAWGNTMNQQLITAASDGNTSQVIELLRQGANVNARDSGGRTAIMAATYGRHVKIVEALIAAGADVNQRDIMLNNPFLYVQPRACST